MPDIAVTGAAGLVGQPLVELLAGHAGVGRVVGFDVREPARRPRSAEFHRVDIAGTRMAPLLHGVDVIVHLAGVVDPIPDESLMARVNVGGTRQVLDAAATVGAKRVVRVSSASVYGAWPNNPVPLTEDAPLRPNPQFSPAVQGAEVERLLAEWHREHPDVVTTTLRAAPVVGPGAERLPARILLGRPPLHVRGASPPVQVVHVDDLVSALALAATTDLPGVYNVAADGWLTADHARALAGRANVPAVPEEALTRALHRAWVLGVGDIPPGVVPYLVHPWVIANDRLRAKGWEPRHTNEQAIREGVATLAETRSGPDPRIVAAGVAGAAVVTVVAVRRRRARKSS
ncbi:MAG: NAD-dependent epimerase/dehydratase family protein [Acidimicrobiia bacterium]